MPGLLRQGKGGGTEEGCAGLGPPCRQLAVSHTGARTESELVPVTSGAFSSPDSRQPGFRQVGSDFSAELCSSLPSSDDGLRASAPRRNVAIDVAAKSCRVHRSNYHPRVSAGRTC